MATGSRAGLRQTLRRIASQRGWMSWIASIFCSSNNPFLFQVASTFMTADNERQLQGNWRLLLFNQDTWPGHGSHSIQPGLLSTVGA
jgi:hypothetical protein